MDTRIPEYIEAAERLKQGQDQIDVSFFPPMRSARWDKPCATSPASTLPKCTHP
ncbi:MAG: hypothetical protein ABI700_10850 [Chloroflexota bacterium]